MKKFLKIPSIFGSIIYLSNWIAVTRSDIYHAFQTHIILIFVTVIMASKGMYHWTSLEFSIFYYTEVVGVFYILQILKDHFVLKYFHKWMHESKTLYAYHKVNNERIQ